MIPRDLETSSKSGQTDLLQFLGSIRKGFQEFGKYGTSFLAFIALYYFDYQIFIRFPFIYSEKTCFIRK
jgi:hypothetical protein